MPIRISCGTCGKRLAANDEATGRRLKCPGCGGEILIPTHSPDIRLPEEPTEPPPVPVAGTEAIVASDPEVAASVGAGPSGLGPFLLKISIAANLLLA